MDGRHHEKAAELEGEARQQPAQTIGAQNASEDVHPHARQSQLERDEDAISAGQRQQMEDDAQRIKAHRLPICQEGMPGKDEGIPPGNVALRECVDDEALPGVVLQHQIGQQWVVWRFNCGRRRAERLEQRERIGGEEGAASQYHRRKEQ